jgi:hypothetical protein
MRRSFREQIYALALITELPGAGPGHELHLCPYIIPICRPMKELRRKSGRAVGMSTQKENLGSQRHRHKV